MYFESIKDNFFVDLVICGKGKGRENMLKGKKTLHNFGLNTWVEFLSAGKENSK